MDMKMQAFLDKVKDMADKTGKVSRHAAGVAGKKANDLALATRINLQIFDLNTECEALYKRKSASWCTICTAAQRSPTRKWTKRWRRSMPSRKSWLRCATSWRKCAR